MANNIFQIWDALSRQTPFAVIRDYWKPGYYVIVQRVECEKMPYGQALGYLYAMEGTRTDWSMTRNG